MPSMFLYKRFAYLPLYRNLNLSGEEMRKDSKRCTPKSASTSSSTNTSVAKSMLKELGLMSLEQAKLCASTALLKLFQEHDSAQDFSQQPMKTQLRERCFANSSKQSLILT